MDDYPDPSGPPEPLTGSVLNAIGWTVAGVIAVWGGVLLLRPTAARDQGMPASVRLEWQQRHAEIDDVLKAETTSEEPSSDE